MKPREILIVTTERDMNSEMVIEELKKRGIPHSRFDTDLFNGKIQLTLNLSSNGVFEGTLHFSEKDLPFSEIGLVWYRRIGSPLIEEEALCGDPEFAKWASEECEWTLNAALTTMPALIVNPFSPNNRIHTNKWVQMKEAAKLGFEIPLSRLTNNTSNILPFWEMTDKEMIFKKVRRGLFFMKDGRRLLLHTSKVPVEKMTPENIERMRFCPMFLQKHIVKKYDIRSVVVGDRVFSFALYSQEVEEGKIDYRNAFLHGGQKNLRHEHINLGTGIDRKLIQFVRKFGNHFGVVDLIQTPDDRLIFLEDNPEGQWGWLEKETGMPVASAVAEYLVSLLGT